MNDILFLVRIQNVYGKDMVYPANPTAVQFTELTGKKTFDSHDLSVIEDLGYIIQVQTPVLV